MRYEDWDGDGAALQLWLMGYCAGGVARRLPIIRRRQHHQDVGHKAPKGDRSARRPRLRGNCAGAVSQRPPSFGIRWRQYHQVVGHEGWRRDGANRVPGALIALSALPQGRLASGGDNTIRLWDTESGVEFQPHPPLAGKSAGDAARGPSSFGFWRRIIRLWNTNTPKKLPHCTTIRSTSRYFHLAALPDGRLASGSRDSTVIRLWDTTNQDRDCTTSEATGLG